MLGSMELTTDHLDPMPYYRLHRNLPSSRLPPRPLISTSPLPALLETRLCPHPRSHASRTHIRNDTTRNHRLMDSILRSRPRLPHQIRLPHPPLLPT